MLVLARILTFIQFALLGALIGAVLAFVFIMLVGTATGASNINGGLAMGAAGMTPIGGIIGGVIGAVVAWRLIAKASNSVIYGFGYGLAGFCLMLAAGWFVLEELTDGNPYEQGKEPIVHIEWRLPEKFPHHMVDRTFRQMMRSSYMDWPLSDWWDNPRARDEDGKTILRMKVQIRWRVTGRKFQLWRWPNHDDRITVDMGIPKDPLASAEYSSWVEVEDAPGNAYRWRVER